MLASLETRPFFTASEEPTVSALGLPDSQQEQDIRLALGALFLAPVLDVGLVDGATSSAEFEAIERFLERLESEFELGTKEALESIGTEMGMLPIMKGSWDNAKFEVARQLLADILNRLADPDAHAIRTAIAQSCLEVAQAGNGWLHVHSVDGKEKHRIQMIVTLLQLNTTSAGLHLSERAGL